MASRPQRVIPRLLLITFLSVFSLFRNVAGYVQHHIIDDADSSIQYSPNGWSKGNLCVICSEGLDLDQIHSKTWTNGSTLRGSGNIPVWFTFSFTGIYLDIVFIAQAVHPISNSTQGVLNDANVTITVDGESFPYSLQLVQGTDKNQLLGYSKSLFAQGWTTNSKHDVRVDLAPLGSTLSLDYIAYSVEVEDEASPTPEIETAPKNTPDRIKVIIVGIVTSVLAFVALLAFFVWWCLRRKRVAQTGLQPIGHIVSFVPSGPPPASRSREKLPFPSDTSSAPSPTNSTASPTMTRQRLLTFSSSMSQSLLRSPASPDESQSGISSIQVPVLQAQGPHPAVLGFQLGNQMSTTTVYRSSLNSTLGDMEVPPPAYSPPQSSNQ